MPDLEQPRRRPSLAVWPLTVVDALDVTPRMRRVRFVGESLEAFPWRPGQDVVLNIPTPQGEARRHYTVRAFDRAERRLDIDFALHGDSPATRWARQAKMGDTLMANGPRGRTVVDAEADWHLFVGDETAMPAIMAMIESLRPGVRAQAIIEVRDADERQTPSTVADVDIEWFYRQGPAHAASRALIDRMALYAIPPGVGQAAVIGETAMVRAVRQGLIARGFPRERISAEGYWRPGRIGGHDHVFDAAEVMDRVAGKLRDGVAAAFGGR
ncbi:siderophore-interacting protein [Caulobacter sp. KR2-114]|uniref:siderophore-interacting protein n=1 Tax=Caulobacter sp. KR2-114 TaxID=3400912 RepID=UPI003C0BC31D